MKIYLLFIGLSLACLSCSKSNGDENQSVFVDLDNSQEGNLSELVQQIEYVLLEIPDSVPLVRVWKFSLGSGKIFVSDREKNNVLVFDAKGRFEKIIESKGAGPNEFRSMEDYHIFNDHIYVLDGSLKKILKFDFEGEVVEETKIDFHPYNLFSNDRGSLYYFANNPNHEFQSIISETSGKIEGLKTINKDFEGLQYSSVYGFQYDHYDMEIYLKLDTSYEILFFDEALNKIRELVFDFGKYSFPDDKRKEFFMSYERYTYLREYGMIEMIFSFIPIKNHFMMVLSQSGRKPKVVLMNKNLNDIEVIDEMINDIDGFQSDFSPVFQHNGELIQIKSSRTFYNDYINSFGGKQIDTSLLKDSQSIHNFYQTNKNKLMGDHYVVIKNKIKD